LDKISFGAVQENGASSGVQLFFFYCCVRQIKDGRLKPQFQFTQNINMFVQTHLFTVSDWNHTV